MSKTIYAVSAGSYSDYRVVAIFDTREGADDFMATVPDSDYNRVEEYELNPPIADLVRRGYQVWRVHMLRDGTVEYANAQELSVYLPATDGQHSMWRRSTAPAYIGKGVPGRLISTVWAKNEAAAVKITNEHRTAMIANGEWPNA